MFPVSGASLHQPDLNDSWSYWKKERSSTAGPPSFILRLLGVQAGSHPYCQGIDPCFLAVKGLTSKDKSWADSWGPASLPVATCPRLITQPQTGFKEACECPTGDHRAPFPLAPVETAASQRAHSPSDSASLLLSDVPEHRNPEGKYVTKQDIF